MSDVNSPLGQPSSPLPVTKYQHLRKLIVAQADRLETLEFMFDVVDAMAPDHKKLLDQLIHALIVTHPK